MNNPLGVLEIGTSGDGYLRQSTTLLPSPTDVSVSAQRIRSLGLRPGDLVRGQSVGGQEGRLLQITSVSDLEPEAAQMIPPSTSL